MYFQVQTSFILRQRRCEEKYKDQKEKKKERPKEGKCYLENRTPGFPSAGNWDHRASAESAGLHFRFCHRGPCDSGLRPSLGFSRSLRVFSSTRRDGEIRITGDIKQDAVLGAQHPPCNLANL